MFEHVDGEKLARHGADFMAAGTGGSAKYTGRDMPTSHAHLGLTDADFLSAGGDIVKAMQSMEYSQDEIDEVVCLGAQGETPIVCDPWEAKLRPKSGYEARFSLPYSVASMLMHGYVNHSTYTDGAVTDVAVLALADRIRFEVDPASDFPLVYPGWLRVRTRDNRLLEYEGLNQTRWLYLHHFAILHMHGRCKYFLCK